MQRPGDRIMADVSFGCVTNHVLKDEHSARR